MKPGNLIKGRSVLTLILSVILLCACPGLSLVLAQSAPDQSDGTPPRDTPPPPPAQDVNYAYFHDQLAPYGTWIQVDGYGWCWRPDAAIAANPDWRPYYDMGQWVYTENGWFWESDYGWGDIPFHYGNWVIVDGYGWVWVPGYSWGPAWVFWREAEVDACIGWAPLPPSAVFVDGGWIYHGVHYGVDFDFGVGDSYFVFIGSDHFHDDFFRMKGIEYPYHIPRDRVHEFYQRSVLRNNFRKDDHGRLINDGIGRQRMEQLTQHRVEEARFQERDPAVRSDVRTAEGKTENSQHGETVDKVYRPPSESEKRIAPAIAPISNFQSHNKY